MRSSPLALLALALLGPGCAEPVLDAEIAALPDDGMRNGPAHRGGQPCGYCHSSAGGASPTFVLGGTVYQKPTSKIPIEGATIHVTDAAGAAYDMVSNCAGNFYVTDAEWQPTYPFRVELLFAPTGTDIKMTSKIGRATACAECHADPAGTDASGHIYLTSHDVSDMTPPPLTCGSKRGGGG
jgi:hypothetical protein